MFCHPGDGLKRISGINVQYDQGEATNLLNQPLRYYQGTSDRTMQAEYYGVRLNAGVKVTL